MKQETPAQPRNVGRVAQQATITFKASDCRWLQCYRSLVSCGKQPFNSMFSVTPCGSEAGKVEYHSGGRDAKPDGKDQESRRERAESLSKDADISKTAQLIEAKVNKDKLITLIRASPSIWDIRVAGYTMQHVRAQSWEKIVSHFIHNFSQLPDKEKHLLVMHIQKIWRSMRICYCREIKKNERIRAGTKQATNHKYMYFDQLKFLDAVSRKIPDPLHVKKDENEHHSKSEDLDKNAWNDRVTLTRQDDGEATTKRIKGDQSEVAKFVTTCVTTENRTQRGENDEEKLFLLSLLSEMHKVPPQNKLKLRSDIITAIANAQAHKPQQWLPMQYSPASDGFQQNQLHKCKGIAANKN